MKNWSCPGSKHTFPNSDVDNLLIDMKRWYVDSKRYLRKYHVYYKPIFLRKIYEYMGFPGGSVVKHPLANAGDIRDVGLIPGLCRSLGEGDGNPLQDSCLGNPMARGAWWSTVHGVEKDLDMT